MPHGYDGVWFSLSCFTLVSSVYSKLLQSNLVHLVIVGGGEPRSPEIVAAHPNGTKLRQDVPLLPLTLMDFAQG